MAADPAVPGVDVLYAHHHDWLHAWLRRRLGGAEQAADLAHETFLRILHRRVQLASLHEPRAWLRTVARGLVVDHWRRQALERAWLETLAHQPEPLAASAEEQQLVLELLERLCQVVEGLRAPVRRAFLLHRLEGLRQAQIAECMKVTLRTVERYLAEAMYHCYQLRHGEPG